MSKILYLIKRSGFQRFFYLAILLLVNFFSLKDGVSILKSVSSLGVPYFYFWIIPSLILLYQIIRNDIIGWILFVSLYLFYLVWLLFSIIDGIRLDFKEYDAMTYIVFMVIILIYLGFGYFIILIKPRKR
jgi:hypothetical protein